MAKDYYKTLGVNKNASQDEIKKAFRKLAHEHHPDKGNGNEAKFKEINEAYQALNNKEKRAQYDQFGQTFDGAQGFGGFGGANPFAGGANPFGGFSGGQSSPFGDAQGRQYQNVDFDLGDIFGSFFGGGMGRRSKTQRGQDMEASIQISLKDAVFGTSQIVNIKTQSKCEACNGTGAKDGSDYETCRTCNGAGRVVTTILGQFQTQTTCPECRGKGKQIKNKCGQCGGNGTNLEFKDVRIEIPAGINDGQSVRLSGQGNSGEQGAPAGDLYINVQVKAEPGFEREGDDLIHQITIPFTLATLGGDIKVKTIDGQVKLKIPAGTQSNKQFILRNKGVNHLNARGRGNQIVIVNVDVPTKLTRKQKELIQDLDKELNQKKSWF